jgi:predicted site-specific integrase-resolvase
MVPNDFVDHMPIKINGETYYRTSEAAQMAGISRSTLLRWLDESIIKDASRRDRRGWRLFTEGDIERIEDEASKVK